MKKDQHGNVEIIARKAGTERKRREKRKEKRSGVR